MSTKKILSMLQLGLTFITPMALSMEENYPQLQLEKITTPCSIINAEIYIKKQSPGSNWGLIHEDVHFIHKSYRKKISKRIGINTALVNDPFMPIVVMVNGDNWSQEPIILQNNIKINKFPESIPAKLLWNLTTESILNLTVDGYPVKLVCKKNKLINNDEFHEQFNLRMKKLYENPDSGTKDCPEVELTPANVMTRILLATTIVIDADGRGTTTTKEYSPCLWGPNGCSSEKAFGLINAKKALIPYNNNVFNLVTQRQINPKFKVLPT